MSIIKKTLLYLLKVFFLLFKDSYNIIFKVIMKIGLNWAKISRKIQAIKTYFFFLISGKKCRLGISLFTQLICWISKKNKRITPVSFYVIILATIYIEILRYIKVTYKQTLNY